MYETSIGWIKMKNSVLAVLFIACIVASQGQPFGRQRRPQRRRQFQFPRWQPPSTGNGPPPMGTIGNRGTRTNSRNSNRPPPFGQQRGRANQRGTPFFQPRPTRRRLYNNFRNTNNNPNNDAIQNSTDTSPINFNRNPFQPFGANSGFGAPSQFPGSTNPGGLPIGSSSPEFNIQRGRNDNQGFPVQSQNNQQHRSTDPFSWWNTGQRNTGIESNFFRPNRNSFQIYNQGRNTNKNAQNSIFPLNRRRGSTMNGADLFNNRQQNGFSQTNNLLNQFYNDQNTAHVSTWNQFQAKPKQTTLPTRKTSAHHNLQKPEVTTIISQNPQNKDQTIIRLSVNKIPVIRDSSAVGVKRRRIGTTPVNRHRNTHAALNRDHLKDSNIKEQHYVKVLEKTPVGKSKVTTPLNPKHSGSETSTKKPNMHTKTHRSTKTVTANRNTKAQHNSVPAISRLSGMPLESNKDKVAPNNFFEFKIDYDALKQQTRANDVRSNSPVGLFGSVWTQSLGNHHISNTNHQISNELLSGTVKPNTLDTLHGIAPTKGNSIVTSDVIRPKMTSDIKQKSPKRDQNDKGTLPNLNPFHRDQTIADSNAWSVDPVLPPTKQTIATHTDTNVNKYITQHSSLSTNGETYLYKEKTTPVSDGRIAVKVDPKLPNDTPASSNDSNFFKPWGDLGLGDISMFDPIGTFGAGMFGYRNAGNEPPTFTSLLNMHQQLHQPVHGGHRTHEPVRTTQEQINELSIGHQPQSQFHTHLNNDRTSVVETVSQQSVPALHSSSLLGQAHLLLNTHPQHSETNNNQRVHQDAHTFKFNDAVNIAQPLHTPLTSRTHENTRFSHFNSNPNDLFNREPLPKPFEFVHKPPAFQAFDTIEHAHNEGEASPMSHSRRFLGSHELSPNRLSSAHDVRGGSNSHTNTNPLNIDESSSLHKTKATLITNQSKSTLNHGRLSLNGISSHSTKQPPNAVTNFHSINPLSHAEPKQAHSQFFGTIQGFDNKPIFELNNNNPPQQSVSLTTKPISTPDTADKTSATQTSKQYVDSITDKIMSLMMNDHTVINSAASKVGRDQETPNKPAKHSSVSIHDSKDKSITNDIPPMQNVQPRIFNTLLSNVDLSTFDKKVLEIPTSEPTIDVDGNLQSQGINHNIINENASPFFLAGLLGDRDHHVHTVPVNNNNMHLSHSDANTQTDVGTRVGETAHQQNSHQTMPQHFGPTQLYEQGKLQIPTVYQNQNDAPNTNLNADNVASDIPKTFVPHGRINNFQPFTLPGVAPVSLLHENSQLSQSVEPISSLATHTQDKVNHHGTLFPFQTHTVFGDSVPVGSSKPHSEVVHSNLAKLPSTYNANGHFVNIHSMFPSNHTRAHTQSVDNSIQNLFPSQSLSNFETGGITQNTQNAPLVTDTSDKHTELLLNDTVVQSISDLIHSMPAADLDTVLQNINLNNSIAQYNTNTQHDFPIVNTGTITNTIGHPPGNTLLGANINIATNGDTDAVANANAAIPQTKIGNIRINSMQPAVRADQTAHSHHHQAISNNVINAPYLSGFDFGIAFSNELKQHADIKHHVAAAVPTVSAPIATTPDNTMTFLDDLLSGLRQILDPETTIPPTTTADPPSTTPACTPSSDNYKCKGKGMFSTLGTMETWCLSTCKTSECPENICDCGCAAVVPVTANTELHASKNPGQTKRSKWKKGHIRKNKRNPNNLKNRRFNNKNRKLLSSHRRRPRRTTTTTTTTPEPIPTTEEPPEIEWEDIVTTTTEIPSTTEMPTTPDYMYYDYDLGSTISPFDDIKLQNVEQSDVTGKRSHVDEIPQVAWASEIKSRLAKLAKNAIKANEHAGWKEDPHTSTIAPYHTTGYWEMTTPTPFTTPPTREWKPDWPTPRPAERRPGSWDRRPAERRRKPQRKRDQWNDRWSRNTTPPYDTWGNDHPPTTYEPPSSRGQWDRGGWGRNDRSRGWDNGGGWGGRNRNSRNNWGGGRSRKTTEAPDK